MSDNDVGFAVIGLGMGRVRARTAAATPGARLVAVCDVVEEKAKATAEELGCAYYVSYQEMLERDDISVVGVLTPSGLHAEVATDCLRAGKHVFVTKPLEVTLEKADALIEEARKAQRLLAVDFEMRYLPDNRWIKRALAQGKFGRPIFGDVRLKWYRAQEYYSGWRGTWKLDGGGSLMNQGAHVVDLLRWFMGPVASVQGRIGIFAHQIETEDATTALVTFKSGAWGLIQTTTTFYPSQPIVIEIHGDLGSVITQDNKITLCQLLGEEAGEGAAAEASPPESAPRNIFEDMVSAVRQGTPLAVDGIEGRKAVELILAIYQSARTGETVYL